MDNTLSHLPHLSHLSHLSQASQVTNRDQFAVTQVTIEVLKKSRNPPRFEKERYEGYIYSNSVPETMILRDRTSNRPFRVRARDEDFATVRVRRDQHLHFNHFSRHLSYNLSLCLFIGPLNVMSRLIYSRDILVWHRDSPRNDTITINSG